MTTTIPRRRKCVTTKSMTTIIRVHVRAVSQWHTVSMGTTKAIEWSMRPYVCSINYPVKPRVRRWMACIRTCRRPRLRCYRRLPRTTGGTLAGGGRASARPSAGLPAESRFLSRSSDSLGTEGALDDIREAAEKNRTQSWSCWTTRYWGMNEIDGVDQRWPVCSSIACDYSEISKVPSLPDGLPDLPFHFSFCLSKICSRMF